MAEWLIEEGIAEHRAVRLSGERIIEARIDWPGALANGQVEDAVLVSRAAGSPRGTARFASGEDALVDRLPRDACEGAALRLEITRPAQREPGRSKLAQARPTDSALRPAPTLALALQAEGHTARIVRRFPLCDWDELWLEAWSGRVEFDGGELSFFDTPAMTLVDVDGTLPAPALAMGAVPALGQAIRRFDLGGSVGVDFPTLTDKAQRRAVDAALGEALHGFPHERTAMNGFGFVQIVSRRARVPLTARIANARPTAAARRLLRLAEGLDGAGAILLTCHPAVLGRLKPGWLEDLAGRTGREVRSASNPALALEAGQAQIVPR